MVEASEAPFATDCDNTGSRQTLLTIRPPPPPCRGRIRTLPAGHRQCNDPTLDSDPIYNWRMDERREKDARLGEDIRLLGRLLGDTIRERDGEREYALIEEIR